MKRVAIFLTVGLIAQAAWAQSAEEKARIDYEAARLALEANEPEIALEKLEKVIGVLGELPDLLLLTSKAAFESGKITRAKELISRTFAVADDIFKKSESYKELITLSAKIEVDAPALEAREKGYWTDPDTKLMWTAKTTYQLYWDRADDYCNALTLGGYRDWRLATTDELKGIYDSTSKKLNKLRGPIDIPSQSDFIWSGTPDGSRIWVFSFQSGQRYSLPLRPSLQSTVNVSALCARVPK